VTVGEPLETVTGDGVAAFCDAEHVRVVGIVYGIVGDRDIAEDIAQETFVRVYLHWERVRSADSPQAWTARVASNLANSWWRRRYAEYRANGRHGIDPDEDAGDETADRLAVRRAVAGLPRRQRTVIALRYMGGLSVAETALAMRCREGTVKSLTSKAMSQLRTHFVDDDASPSTRLVPVAVSPHIDPEKL
jgi:RNA polymerase sigma-70 factor (sigma-E family)